MANLVILMKIYGQLRTAEYNCYADPLSATKSMIPPHIRKIFELSVYVAGLRGFCGAVRMNANRRHDWRVVSGVSRVIFSDWNVAGSRLGRLWRSLEA